MSGGIALGIWSAFATAYAAPLAAIGWHRDALLAAGIVLMATGIGLRFYAVHTLGRYFTLTVRTHQGQRVIEAGPYRLVRHPSYSVALANWLTLLTIVFPAIAIAYRIRVEEAVLLDALGDDYRRYMGHTKRLVPYVV
ncbi:MAG: isoprenylcysteine carboxylmethyltransferase family protein [Chloroflexi bacterium]|nr:MAG: isoprenylcysteine carboxylmethyltransferase family protein [Chloroflexota bacterium]